MYISTIKIQNFRNIKDAAFDLTKGLTLLVGSNNSGKTNIFDAIRAALGKYTPNENDLAKDANWERETNFIYISITFSSLNDDERAEFLDILNFNPDNFQDSTITINYKWIYDEFKDRGIAKYWAGNSNEENVLPAEIFYSINVTLLEPLRDAKTELNSGSNTLLSKLIKNQCCEEEKKSRIVESINTANTLICDELSEISNKIEKVYKDSSIDSGFKRGIGIQASEVDFNKIASSMKLVLKLEDTSNVQELASNGLGYNNLIYISAVISNLLSEIDKKKTTLPILLIEEPEAHLDPQHQLMLIEYINKIIKENEQIQVILSSHSSVISANTDLKSIRSIYYRANKVTISSFLPNDNPLEFLEYNKLTRFLDITKATMLFAKGIILVEGSSEEILIPVIAKDLIQKHKDFKKYESLKKLGISVIQVYGVDFKTITKVLNNNGLEIPVAIITDGDPKKILLCENYKCDDEENCDKTKKNCWIPKDFDIDNGDCSKIQIKKDLENFKNEYNTVDSNIQIFNSNVTLEFDLALAGKNNPQVIVEAWENCFKGNPRNLNSKVIQDIDKQVDQVLKCWQEICLSETSGSKAELAQCLACEIESKPDLDFKIPEYIKKAIGHVVRGVLHVQSNRN